MNDQPDKAARVARRRFLIGGAAVVGGISGKLLYDRNESFWHADVVIAKAADYDNSPLVDVIKRGLKELGLDRKAITGKSILLKPNLVEPSIVAPHINTHPLVVRAAAEAFRSLDANEVFVAEGQGHCRDTYLVLEQSGLQEILQSEKLPFVDLNHDDIFDEPNRLGLTSMRQLHLPASLRRADLVVSMPKMKTHHWAGVTLSMKNFFGVMPGICYGWPKNVLHQNGIEKSILDINATVRPHLAIVDGIIGMEGDGPIMGQPKHAGVLVMGRNLPAVDATCSRLMQINPQRISYLAYASGRLGAITEARITQRGESIRSLAQPFQLLDHPVMDRFRG